MQETRKALLPYGWLLTVAILMLYNFWLVQERILTRKTTAGKKGGKADDSESSSSSDSEDDDSTAIPAPDSTHDVVLSRVPAQQPAKVASTPSVTITAVPAPGRKQSKPDITASPVKEP